jgi:amidase
VQIIGPYLEDRTPLVFAQLAERQFGGFRSPPGFARGSGILGVSNQPM